MAKNEENPRAFELYLVKHTKSKLYWDGKGFNQKDKKKAQLAEFRLAKTLEWEHKDVEIKLFLVDWRDEASWQHLVPACSSV